MSSVIHTKGGIPDTATHFASLIDHLREAQSDALVLGHLHKDNDALHAQGWFAVGEQLSLVVAVITELAAKGTIRMPGR